MLEQIIEAIAAIVISVALSLTPEPQPLPPVTEQPLTSTVTDEPPEFVYDPADCVEGWEMSVIDRETRITENCEDIFGWDAPWNED